jgi:hypothetical protein
MTQIPQKYQSFVNSPEWKRLFPASIHQLQKDAQLASLNLFKLGESKDFEHAVVLLTDWLKLTRSKGQPIDHFLYRIDLPVEMDAKNLIDSDLATVILLRCFQKVWLREQFSKNLTKDEENRILKDLKP